MLVQYHVTADVQMKYVAYLIMLLFCCNKLLLLYFYGMQIMTFCLT